MKVYLCQCAKHKLNFRIVKGFTLLFFSVTFAVCGDQTNVCMAGIWPSQMMAFLPPSQLYHTAPLYPESHRVFLRDTPVSLFLFFKMHIQ